MADEDDPVVREFDVVLSTELMDQLYLLQFPLQSMAPGRSRGLGLDRAKACRVKVGRKRVELDLAMDTNCSNFDDDSDHTMDTWTMESSSTPFKTNYAVGVLRGEPAQLHLTPLHAICQMRPSFKHIDQLDLSKKQQEVARLLQISKDSLNEDGASGKKGSLGDKLQTISVTIKRAESERMAERRQRSHAFLAGKDAEEAWMSVELHQPGTEEVKEVIEKLVGTETKPLIWDQNNTDYLASLGLKPTEQLMFGGPMHSGSLPALSTHARLTMPLEAQILGMFHHVHVFRFERILQLVSYDGAGHTEAAVLECLQKVAVLVQGCWVTQAELMYPQASEYHVQCVEYLLLCLAQQAHIDRAAFTAQTELPRSAVTDMLGKLAVKHPDRSKITSWVLKIQPDKAFLKSHPAVASSYKQYWAAQKARVVAALKAPTAVATEPSYRPID